MFNIKQLIGCGKKIKKKLNKKYTYTQYDIHTFNRRRYVKDGFVYKYTKWEKKGSFFHYVPK